MNKTIDVQNNDCGVEHAVSIPASRYDELLQAALTRDEFKQQALALAEQLAYERLNVRAS